MLPRTARTALLVFCFVFGAIGVATSPVAALICWCLLGLVVGVCGWLGADALHTTMRSGWARSDLRCGAVAAGAAVTICLTIEGLVAVLGVAAAAAVVVGVVVTGAYWRIRLASAARRAPARTIRRSASAPAPRPPAASMSTAELCAAWRRSYVELQKADEAAARHDVVARRQEYLDELEHRNRDGFARWLASGARAGGDPQRYLTAGG
ncbi:hypothetical protein ACGFMK_27870 [Amycolatopsis sp. NPDC049252]|uniref:hypothetical protein n=1 Tax=Amycolatopsis sp. NPDC049252 TaxID=3363933 RepID=UPI00371D2B28